MVLISGRFKRRISENPLQLQPGLPWICSRAHRGPSKGSEEHRWDFIRRQLPSPHNSDSSILGSQCPTGAWSLHSANSGDIVIALLDSGIWPESLKVCRGECESGTDFNSSNCNQKLVGARVFSRGYETSSGPINETEEYKSPRDQAAGLREL